MVSEVEVEDRTALNPLELLVAVGTSATVAVPVCVPMVAVTVTVCACETTAGAVYIPAVEMVPIEGLIVQLGTVVVPMPDTENPCD
jgi:hypothetical protein